MHHLLKAANIEGESNFLKFTMTVESVQNMDIGWQMMWIDHDGAYYFGHLESVGGNDLIPCKIRLKISVKYPIPSCDTFCAIQKRQSKAPC